MLMIQAPAKINLTLEVLGKRDDGYHEIVSVIQTISLCDILMFQKAGAIEIQSNLPGWEPEKSLIPKTIRLLQETAHCPDGVKISIEKHIPLISGLGGESSDAAAVLLGLNRLWELKLSIKELSEIAANLGSDVTFFLHGGTALLEGRGENVIPLPPLPKCWILLVIPPVPRLHGKTEQQYKSLTAGDFTDGAITRRLVTTLQEGKEVTSSMLCNTFENLHFQPRSDIEHCWQLMIKTGAENVHLAGSGPTLFTMLKDKAEAEDLDTRLREQHLETYLAGTI